MRIDVDVDVAPLLLRLRSGERRLAYAVVNAIRETALKVQAAEREHVQEEFEVRKPFVLRQAAIIKPFPSVAQRRPFAEISVGRRPRLLLSEFERGGAREPFTPGAKRVAVPLTGRAARPAFKDPVPAEFRVGRLRFKLHTTSTGKVQIKGRNRTFILKATERAPEGGIFRRVGKTSDDIRMIYSFRKRPRLKASLRFVPVARETASRWFREELQKQAVEAIARSRGQGL